MSAITMKAVRNVRKLERPRPLRTTSSDSVIKPHAPPALDFSNLKSPTVENILQDLDALHISFSNGNFDDSTISLLVQVCNQLKSKGQQLDLMFKENLDRYFVTLRNASRDERLDMHCRLRLLEIIELRAMKWKTNENLTNYYKQKLLEMESIPQSPSYTSLLSQSATVPYMPSSSSLSHITSQMSQMSLSQGEVLRSSGKFSKPTKIPGKNFYKDEIIIRNSDSGKVSPGARDRLVQITGPNDEAISQAKVLIDDTIRRNASPIRDKAEPGSFGMATSVSSTSLNSSVSDESGGPVAVTTMPEKKVLMHSFSMGDATLGEYTYSVSVGQDILRISGPKVDLVQTAKLVLEEYFAGQAELTEKPRPFVASNSYPAFANPFAATNLPTGPQSFGISKQEPFKFDGIAGEKVNTWLCSSNSSISKKTSPLTSSSSEEETYKGNGSMTNSPKAFVESTFDSPITSPLATKIDAPVFQPNPVLQSMSDSTSALARQRRALYSVNSRKSSGESSENLLPKIKYTRDFLLECSLSSHSRVRPKDTAALSLEGALYFLESPKVFFDPSSYQDQWKGWISRKDSFRQSPPQSQDN